jgi:hypothetical protein
MKKNKYDHVAFLTIYWKNGKVSELGFTSTYNMRKSLDYHLEFRGYSIVKIITTDDSKLYRTSKANPPRVPWWMQRANNPKTWTSDNELPFSKRNPKELKANNLFSKKTDTFGKLPNSKNKDSGFRFYDFK